MSKCSKDFYLEPGSRICKPCDELCHQAIVRGTVELCRRYCPVGVDTPVTEIPIDQITHLMTPAYEQSTISLSRDSSFAAQCRVIFLAVLIILISLVAIVVLLKRPITLFLNERNTKKHIKNPRSMVFLQSTKYNTKQNATHL